MAALALGGSAAGRPGASAAGLAGAVFILLVADPWLSGAIGFQLSVAATAGMLMLAGPIAAWLGFLPPSVGMAAATTIAAQVGVGPLLLFHFGQIPLVALPANVLAFPLVGPALLVGLAAAVVGSVAAPLGSLLGGLAMLPLRGLELLASGLARFPVATITSDGGSVVALVIGVALTAGVAWLLRRRRGMPRPVVVGVTVVIPVFVWATAIRAGPPPGLEVVFFDVGQGDAALVRSPGGATVLIDGGPDPEAVAIELAGLGVKHLNAVVATHPHLDHYMGLPAVVSRFPVDVVFDLDCETSEGAAGTYQAFLRAVRDRGIPEVHPHAGDVLNVGDLRFDVLNPDRCWENSNSDPNNDSIVLLLTYDGDTVLFANEPEAEAQQVMLDAGWPLVADVLNVPHHGAGTSIPTFLDAVDPAVAVVSVGPNDYGHPVGWVIDQLEAGGATVVRTDLAGDVIVRFEGQGVQVASRPP
jgi:competence protein ComEC